jgi:guanylate kinase
MLKYHKEFKEALGKYNISGRAQEALKGLHLVLLVAPSSTGRNTVIRKLLESPDYYFIISDTTRAPQLRDGQMEKSGEHYFFRSEEEMLVDIKAGEFLEAALIHEQQVSGISVRELEKAKALNKIAITDIEITGADNVMRVNPDTKVMFLIPPSFEEWQSRITGRGHMSEREMKNRLTSAVKEFDAALHHSYYNFVIADNVGQAAELIDAIARGKYNTHQGRGVSLIHHLQDSLQQKLSTIHNI